MAGFIERIYAHCPVPIQNLGISLFGLYWKRERLGAEFERTVAAFRERDRWPPDRMRDHVNGSLRRVLRRAWDVPYYRETWAEAGLTERHLRDIEMESLNRLPVLAKQEVRRRPGSFVPDRGPKVGRLRTYHSSGSTGTPIRILFTQTTRQRITAAREVRSFGWAGTSVLRPRAMIGGRLVVPRGVSTPPYYRFNSAERQSYFSAYHISPSTIGDYVNGFNRHRPDSVTGYAFSQFLIARLMLQHGLSFDYQPAASITSSEQLTPAMARVIREAWSCRAYEEYGSAENAGLATECEHGRLHVSPDFGVIEIVDDDGSPVAPGVEGQILCTGLLGDAQLLVRYAIGDVGTWSDERCPCGRDHLPVLQGVVGRIEDTVVGPDGRQMVRFHGIFLDMPFVLEGQVVQEELDRFVVRVIAEDGFGTDHAREIRRRFAERLGQVRVQVDRVDQLERTPGGKVKAVISHLGPNEPDGG